MRAVFETCVGRMYLESPDIQNASVVSDFGWTDDDESVPEEMVMIVQEIQFALVSNNNLPISPQLDGTEFQKIVWKEIQKIGISETITYKELAQRIGRPKAIRAVASACGKNRIALVIPCHRVIKSNGNIGKYRWGIEKKKVLLENESE